MNLWDYALRTAKSYYIPQTFDHALRVAQNVADNSIIPEEIMHSCLALALMHDLLEDTDWDINNMPIDEENKQDLHFVECLRIITKPKEMAYNDYIKMIHDYAKDYPEAYWVKIADMKDHLAQTETLTEKLKEKYLSALSFLL